MERFGGRSGVGEPAQPLSEVLGRADDQHTSIMFEASLPRRHELGLCIRPEPASFTTVDSHEVDQLDVVPLLGVVDEVAFESRG